MCEFQNPLLTINVCRLADFNIKKYLNGARDDLVNDASFVAANTRRTINGYMYGNLNSALGLAVSMGSRVRWSIIDVDADSAVSSESVMWEYNNVADSSGRFGNSVTMSSPGYVAVDMNPQQVGEWVLSSGSETSKAAGMVALYMVQPASSSSSKSDSSSASLGRGTVFGVFVAIVVAGVAAVLVMSLFMFKSALNLPILKGDMDPILPDSSHHIMLNPRQGQSSGDSSSPVPASKSVEL
jgi:hypothetical protein